MNPGLFVVKYGKIADEAEKLVGTDKDAIFCVVERLLLKLINLIDNSENEEDKKAVAVMADELYEIWCEVSPEQEESNGK